MSELSTIISRWENAIFLVPALVATLFVVLQIVGMGLDSLGGHGHGFDHGHGGVGHGHGHGHGQGDAGHAHDHAGAQGHGTHDHAHGDPGHAHADGHHHGHHSTETRHEGVVAAVLNWLNVGRAPFMLIFELLLLGFGISGVAGISVLYAMTPTRGAPAVALTAPVALILGALLAKSAGGLVARFMPTLETSGVSASSLVGLFAEVASGEVTASSGRASVRDPHGDLFTVFCRLAPGSPAAKRGDRVLLVTYAPDEDHYTVKPVEGAPISPAAPQH